MKTHPRKSKLLAPAVMLAAAVIIIVFLVPVSSTLPDGLESVLERFGLQKAVPGGRVEFSGPGDPAAIKTLLGLAGIVSMFLPFVVWRILRPRRLRVKPFRSLSDD